MTAIDMAHEPLCRRVAGAEPRKRGPLRLPGAEMQRKGVAASPLMLTANGVIHNQLVGSEVDALRVSGTDSSGRKSIAGTQLNRFLTPFGSQSRLRGPRMGHAKDLRDYSPTPANLSVGPRPHRAYTPMPTTISNNPVPH